MNVFSQDPFIFFTISFFALLFLGEPAILSIALLSSTQQFITPLSLIVLALITAVIAELFWFLLGRYTASFTLGNISRFTEGYVTLRSLIKKLHVDKPMPLLFVTRPFTGLTIVAIIYLARTGLSTRKFALYSLLVNAFWTPIVVGIGVATGNGYARFLALFDGIYMKISITILFIIVIMFMYKSISKYAVGLLSEK